MPREIINERRVSDSTTKELEVSWNRIGWVQASIYPYNWQNSGDAFIVDLTPRMIDKLIKTLRKAKRQAYGNGYTHYGFSDIGEPSQTAELVLIPGGAIVTPEPIRDAIII
jgi:hypothetical protein